MKGGVDLLASMQRRRMGGMVSVVDKVQFTGLEIHDQSPDEDTHLGCRRSREFEANSKLGSGRLDVK